MTWHVLYSQPLTHTYNIATVGDVLYAARTDGLWRRSIDSVPAVTVVSWGSVKSHYR